MKAVLTVFWRLLRAYLYYPLIVGLAIWLWLNDAHWIWGLALLIFVLMTDRIWLLVAKRVLSWRPKG